MIVSPFVKCSGDMDFRESLLIVAIECILEYNFANILSAFSPPPPPERTKDHLQEKNSPLEKVSTTLKKSLNHYEKALTPPLPKNSITLKIS